MDNKYVKNKFEIDIYIYVIYKLHITRAKRLKGLSH